LEDHPQQQPCHLCQELQQMWNLWGKTLQWLLLVRIMFSLRRTTSLLLLIASKSFCQKETVKSVILIFYGSYQNIFASCAIAPFRTRIAPVLHQRGKKTLPANTTNTDNQYALTKNKVHT
jgi:hypothetical protein